MELSVQHRVLAALLLVAVGAGILALMPQPPGNAAWEAVVGAGLQPAGHPAAANNNCLACHSNIFDERFTEENQIAGLEKIVSVPGFWAAAARGVDPAAAGRTSDEAIRFRLERDVDATTWKILLERYRVALVKAAEGQPGLGELDSSRALLAHPHLGLFVSHHSPHARISCVACHGGDAAGRDFASAGHATSMRPVEYLQADCLACHRSAYDIAETAPVLAQGRFLFTTLGCVDCHKSEVIGDFEKRKVGPDLRHVQNKLSRAFVENWLMDPTAFRPSTAMPRVIRPDDPDGKLKAAAIAEYLFANSTAAAQGDPPNIAGDYERGRMLFAGHGLDDATAASRGLPVGLKAGIGCLGCHTNLNDWHNNDGVPWIVVDLMRRGSLTITDAQVRYAAMTYEQRQAYAMKMESPKFIHFGPELSAIGQQLTMGRDVESAWRWLVAWLKDPRQYHATTLMPNLRLSDQEAADLAVYLLGQKRGDGEAWGAFGAYRPSVGRSTLLEMGKHLVSQYGCMNCHDINGPAEAQAFLDLSDWGRKPTERLDFSHLDLAHHTRQDWLVAHLTVPPNYSAGTVDLPQMPFFHLTAFEAQALSTFVLGNRRDTGFDARTAQSRLLAKGRALTEMHNCVGCHQTETNLPAIQQYFNAAWVSSYAPPPLHGEGAKVRDDWLKEFLGHVTQVRPLPLVRMPTFNLEAGDVAAVTDYFHAAAGKESGELRQWMIAGDWRQLDEWALEHGQAAAIDLDPAYSTAEERARTRRDVLFKAEFLAELYGNARPTDGYPRALAAGDGEFARGQMFFMALKCLDCHVMTLAGAASDPAHAKAPNLDLTARRLQTQWVRAWVQEPDVVQHGTNMPAYFSGVAVYSLNGRPVQEAMTMPAEQAARLEQFGRTVGEQTRLLIGFLYGGEGDEHKVAETRR